MHLPAPILLTAVLLGGPDDSSAGQDPRTIRDLVLPDAHERAWLEIPWHTSLWEARRIAAREGKPILLWEMDGNPLGCT